MGTISWIRSLSLMMWLLHGVVVRCLVSAVAGWGRGGVSSVGAGAEPSVSGVCVDGLLSKGLRGRAANREVESYALCIVCARAVLLRDVVRGILGFSHAMATDMIKGSIEYLEDDSVIVAAIWMDTLQSVCSCVLLISSDYREGQSIWTRCARSVIMMQDLVIVAVSKRL